MMDMPCWLMILYVFVKILLCMMVLRTLQAYVMSVMSLLNYNQLLGYIRRSYSHGFFIRFLQNHEKLTFENCESPRIWANDNPHFLRFSVLIPS